jgi:hypothetical protein
VNDRPESESDSPEIAEVRRLLADARHDEPMPDDVASRLDDVLNDLAAERSPAAGTPEPLPAVIPISARRRRRAAGMLVAAAAIVVGGVVGAQNLHLPSSSGGGASTAQEPNAASAQEDVPRANTSGGAERSTEKAQDHATKVAPTISPEHLPLVVHPRQFAADALQGRALVGRYDAQAFTTLSGDCAALAKRARAVPVVYQHAPAALVYRRPQGSTQVVDLFVCGSRQPVRTTTLPTP